MSSYDPKIICYIWSFIGAASHLARWLSVGFQPKAAGSTPAGALSYDDEYDNDIHIHYHHYYCVSNMDL